MKVSTQSKSIVSRSMIGALILALLFSLFGTGSAAASATITTSVDPAPPHAIANTAGNTQKAGFEITFDSTPSYTLYRIKNSTGTVITCRFYDQSGTIFWGGTNAYWEKGYTNVFSQAYATCFDVTDRYYYTPATTSPLSHSDLTWPVGGMTPGRYTLDVSYFSSTSGNTTEQYASTTFLVADGLANIIIQKFEDVNADGVWNDGTDSLWSNTLGSIQLCYFGPFNSTACGYTDSNGKFTMNNVATGNYIFYELSVPTGWKLTTILYHSYALTTPGETHTEYIGNTQSDMICGNVSLTPLDSNSRMTYTLNYQNGGRDNAKSPWIRLYFDNQSTSPAFSWIKFGSTTTETSGDGLTSGTPYLFNLVDKPIGSYTNDVTLQLSFPGGIGPTGGSFTAYYTVGSTYEPDTSNNTCSKTITFAPTAVNASGFTASPQASGMQLSWWANPAGTDWVGFQVQRKLHSSAAFVDVPGAFIAADLAAAGGSNYTYLDTSPQSALTDYQIVPVKSGGLERDPVLSLTTGYQKIFIPVSFK